MTKTKYILMVLILGIGLITFPSFAEHEEDDTNESQIENDSQHDSSDTLSEGNSSPTTNFEPGELSGKLQDLLARAVEAENKFQESLNPSGKSYTTEERKNIFEDYKTSIDDLNQLKLDMDRVSPKIGQPDHLKDEDRQVIEKLAKNYQDTLEDTLTQGVKAAKNVLSTGVNSFTGEVKQALKAITPKVNLEKFTRSVQNLESEVGNYHRRQYVLSPEYKDGLKSKIRSHVLEAKKGAQEQSASGSKTDFESLEDRLGNLQSLLENEIPAQLASSEDVDNSSHYTRSEESNPQDSQTTNTEKENPPESPLTAWIPPTMRSLGSSIKEFFNPKANLETLSSDVENILSKVENFNRGASDYSSSSRAALISEIDKAISVAQKGADENSDSEKMSEFRGLEFRLGQMKDSLRYGRPPSTVVETDHSSPFETVPENNDEEPSSSPEKPPVNSVIGYGSNLIGSAATWLEDFWGSMTRPSGTSSSTDSTPSEIESSPSVVQQTPNPSNSNDSQSNASQNNAVVETESPTPSNEASSNTHGEFDVAENRETGDSSLSSNSMDTDSLTESLNSNNLFEPKIASAETLKKIEKGETPLRGLRNPGDTNNQFGSPNSKAGLRANNPQKNTVTPNEDIQPLNEPYMGQKSSVSKSGNTTSESSETQTTQNSSVTEQQNGNLTINDIAKPPSVTQDSLSQGSKTSIPLSGSLPQNANSGSTNFLNDMVNSVSSFVSNVLPKTSSNSSGGSGFANSPSTSSMGKNERENSQSYQMTDSGLVELEGPASSESGSRAKKAGISSPFSARNAWMPSALKKMEELAKSIVTMKEEARFEGSSSTEGEKPSENNEAKDSTALTDSNIPSKADDFGATEVEAGILKDALTSTSISPTTPGSTSEKPGDLLAFEEFLNGIVPTEVDAKAKGAKRGIAGVKAKKKPVPQAPAQSPRQSWLYQELNGSLVVRK